MLYADPRWLVAVVHDGLVLLGPEARIRMELDARYDDRLALLSLLVQGAEPESLAATARCDVDEARELLAELRDCGAMSDDPRGQVPVSGAPLGPALAAVALGDDTPPLVYTAEEALVLPGAIHPRVARTALRAFTAGIEPYERAAAYAYVARFGVSSAWGDVPDPAALERAVSAARSAAPTSIHVVDLVSGDSLSVSLEELEALDGSGPHRLGPVLRVYDAVPLGDADFTVRARYAMPNIAHAGTETSRHARGAAPTPEEAALIARAEAIERYAAGDVARRPLRRAPAAELEGGVALDDLFRFNDRQLREHDWPGADPAEPRLWMPATGRAGSERWVPAEAVFFPFADPKAKSQIAVASSSGVAAHTDFAEARDRALRELIERDALMWTWIQRVSRERIDPGGLDETTRERIAALEAEGAQVDLINLTLDSLPVVAAAVRGDAVLCMGAGCGREARRAAAKSVEEAGLVWRELGGRPVGPVDPRDVVEPLDHMDAHRSPEALEADSFLWSSPDLVDPREVRAPDAPIEDLVARIGEPLVVDLSARVTTPFHVARALVPGLIPIAFGWDREPLGMRRAGEPIETLGAGTLGSHLDLAEAGPLMPHPLP